MARCRSRLLRAGAGREPDHDARVAVEQHEISGRDRRAGARGADDGGDPALTRLRGHGAELVGEIAQYEDIYRLCFVRGPEGIIIGLSEQLS